MSYLQASLIRKSTRSNLCSYCGEYGHKAACCPNKESNQSKCFKGISDQKKKHSTKGKYQGKGHKDLSKSHATIVESMTIMHVIVQTHVIILILLKKLSETRDLRI